MIPPNFQSNDPLSPEQTAMLRETISSRQKILDAISISVEKDEMESSTQAAAIMCLEATVLHAEQALSTQEVALSSLIQIQMNFESATVTAIDEPEWMSPSEVNKHCEATIADIDSQLILGAANLSESIAQLKQYLPRLSLSIQETKLELSNRILLRGILNQHISDSRTHKSGIERNIGALKPLLSKARDIPAELWERIFSLRVRADLAESTQNTRPTCSVYTALKLSHVCRFWRTITRSVKSLWDFIPVTGLYERRHTALEYLKHSVTLSSTNPVLLCNFSQQPRRGYYHTVPSPGDNILSNFEAYSLQIRVQQDKYYWPDLSTVPFRRPKSLTLQFDTVQGQLGLSNLLGNLAGYTSLKVVFEGEVQQTPVIIPVQVTHLKLDLKTTTSFRITEYLIEPLQELHIRHNGSAALLSNATRIQLPNLKVLGLTPTGATFVHSLELPSLRKVILYGPKGVGDSFPTLAEFVDALPFQRIFKLELRDWLQIENPDMSTWSIMTLLCDIIEKMHSVVSLGCIDSFILGSRLVELVKALKEPPNIAGSKLSHIVIDCCTGITRDECDAVGQLVEKLEVYV